VKLLKLVTLMLNYNSVVRSCEALACRRIPLRQSVGIPEPPSPGMFGVHRALPKGAVSVSVRAGGWFWR